MILQSKEKSKYNTIGIIKKECCKLFMYYHKEYDLFEIRYDKEKFEHYLAIINYVDIDYCPWCGKKIKIISKDV